MTGRRRTLLVGGILIASVLLLLFKRRSTADSESSRSRPSPSGTAATSGAAMPGMSSNPDGSVNFSAADIRKFGVTFGTVELRPLSSEVRTVGSVAADESRIAKVSPKFGGYIERLYVNFTGQPVRRGQPMAEVFSPELLAAEQELLVASRLSRSIGASVVPGVTGNSIDIVAAARQRLRLWDVSDAQINAVIRTGRANRTVTLFAPATGIVMEKKVVQGQALQAGEDLYTIADLSSVWVEADLREADAGRVAPGTRATIMLASFPGNPLTGRVTYVYPVLASESRTVKARVVVPNPGGRLKPGMYATVTLLTGTESALTVPRSAVVQTGERAMVFVDKGGGALLPQTVQLGRSGGEYVEVSSGLSAGQRVVTSAQFLIDSESNLGELMRGMAGAPGDNSEPSTRGQGSNGKGADMRGMPGITPPPAKR